MLNRLASLALAIGALVAVAPAAHAAPSDVDACIERHPDAVRAADVTPGNDLVCVDSGLSYSEGDDTYLWVGGDLDPTLVLHGYGETDPGNDTLSLADWTAPYVDTYEANGYGGMFGVRVLMEAPETIVYTAYDDVIGDPNACGRVTENSNRRFLTGAGADTVQCVTGDIYTGANDDTIIGVTLDSMANAGAGADHVIGDAGADRIYLGRGRDTAEVTGGGADDVFGGAGVDVVDGTRVDDVVSGRLV